MKKPFTKDATWEINTNAIKKLPYKQVILFACDVARLVLPIWEQHYPDDKRPRTAIETAELFVYGQATNRQLEKARSAASFSNAAAYAAANAARYVAYAASGAANAASYATAYTAYYAAETVNDAYIACHDNPQILPTIQTIYKQTTPITIPTTPILQAIAHNIRQTRNFQEYNILLDNLEEFHNIILPRTTPLGLSHYVLYHLTNTH